ncbi:MAG: 2-C-methyl-D-erythritol 4-phosphate cytidylyltransferase, partial [Proteobacteria bacterium]|nr:2-C-methyl-D-erythritol 4-phosphate cytidylyltransferase [Pseudomonadota bacterium]
MASTVALVVAAGRGSRFGAGLPKQYAALGGRPLLGHSLEAFARHPRIDRVKAVIHPDDRALYERAAAGLDLLEPAAGGATRQDSVRRGLESLEALAPAAVLIHDGARPFVDAAVIDRVLDALASAPGAIAALPVTDTLKRSTAGTCGAAGHIAATLEAEHPRCKIDVAVREQYRNMVEGLKKEPRAVALAADAMHKCGTEPRFESIRGGTDGSRLTEMGLPTPNLSTGMHNFHSPLEWA